MAEEDAAETVTETALGPVEHRDAGTGSPVLFVHGSPGGSDQGALMSAFLVARGHRVIALSRPGYLGTPLTDDNRRPDEQASLALALLDALGIERAGLVCWSGGGPTSYRLARRHPERVRALVAAAAVSQPYTFAGGAEARIMSGRVGAWLLGELERHAAKTLVKETLGAEGDLDRKALKAVVEEVWSDQTKRDFLLRLSETITMREPGLGNDHEQFPALPDLELEAVTVPTLLVHGTVDADVPPAHSEHALGLLPDASIVRVEGGTHLALWTDPTSDQLQDQVAAHLAAHP